MPRRRREYSPHYHREDGHRRARHQQDYREHRHRSRTPRQMSAGQRNRSPSWPMPAYRTYRDVRPRDHRSRGRSRTDISPPMRNRDEKSWSENSPRNCYRSRQKRPRSPSIVSYSPRSPSSSSSRTPEECTFPDCIDCPPARPRLSTPPKKEDNSQFICRILKDFANSNEERGEDTNMVTNVNTATTTRTEDVNSQQVSTDPKKLSLDSEILKSLGDRITVEKKYDAPVQEDFALRISDIVTLGLKDEEIENLTETYYPPSNCKLIDPPKMNVEAMNKEASSLERDKRIIRTQQRCSASLAASQKALTILLGQGELIHDLLQKIDENNAIYGELIKIVDQRKEMIKHFSNACRLNADVQHEMSMVRRGLMLGKMHHYSDFVKEAIHTETHIDEYLFGSNMLEIIKNARTNENTRNKDPRHKTSLQKNSKRPHGNHQYQAAPGGGNRHTMNPPSSHRPQRRHHHNEKSGKDKIRRNSKKF